MKRIVIFGKSKHRTRTNLYFLRAFRNLGHKAKWIKYRKIRSYIGEKPANQLCKIFLRWYSPEVLFLYAKDISYDLLAWARERMKIILYYEDPKNDTFEEMVRFGRLAHLFYVTSRGDIPFYEERGIRARYITGGCDSLAHYREEKTFSKYESQLAFIGRPGAKNRIELIQEISSQFDLKVYGKGWEKYGIQPALQNAYADDYRRICASAAIILGQNVVERDLFFSNRIWYTLGCGGFFLTTYTPNMEEIFQRGVHLDWFIDLDECKEKIHYYLNHEEERKQIALQGYKLAHEQYSFEKLAQQMLKDLEEL
ncbi:MAG: hypothetical protein D6785_09860 [Planctomycetota bacterium]|nr:MAG: hypothetical protein D6785_09860 [Planctomycetota bacterium]